MRTYRYVPLFYFYFYWSLYNYAAHAADILTLTTVVQGVDNHSWGLYCRRIRVCWRRCSRIFHFARWLGQLSTVLTKDESPHTGYTFTPWVVSFFYSPQYRALGRRDLDFTSHPNDDGEPWERFSESRPNSLAGVVFKNRVLNSGHPSKYWPCQYDDLLTPRKRPCS